MTLHARLLWDIKLHEQIFKECYKRCNVCAMPKENYCFHIEIMIL